jgi:hypothetical protein
MFKAVKTAKIQENLGETIQPRTVILAYLVPLVVYAGSFAFHATLTYFGQVKKLPSSLDAILH